MNYDFSKQGRVFITDNKDEFSNICWSVHTEAPFNDKVEVDASVRLADCHRVITWDFSTYGIEDPEERIRKIDSAVKTLLEFKEALVQGIEIHENFKVQEKEQ